MVIIHCGIGSIFAIMIILIVMITFESNDTNQSIEISVLGILIGVEIYFISIVNDKRSMMITMILLDENKRKIVEYLANPHSIDEMEIKLKIDRATIVDLINILEQKGFVKRKVVNDSTLYSRTF